MYQDLNIMRTVPSKGSRTICKIIKNLDIYGTYLSSWN